jgi:hypothetical protein
MTTKREGGMRELMWPRAGLMRRLLLATSLTLVVFSDVVPTSPRGCSCCFSGCGGSLSDAASVCRAHALLHRRDELATEVISTPSCARGTRASRSSGAAMVAVEAETGTCAIAKRAEAPIQAISIAQAVQEEDSQCAGPCNRGGPLRHQRCQQGGSNGKRVMGKCITKTTMTAQRTRRCRVMLELSFRCLTSACARSF